MNDMLIRLEKFPFFSIKKTKHSDSRIPIEINFLLLALLIPTCLVLIRDYFMFGYQLLNPTNVIANIIFVGNIFILIATIISLLYIIYYRSYLKDKFLVSLYFPNINIIDLLVVLYLGLLTLTRIAIPDSSFDTVNYHLFLQKPSFLSNVTYNFFPGELGTYFYPLGDRLFYIFRFFLGYRAGTLLNTVVIVIVYFQIKDYLSLNDIITKKYALAISSLFVISTEFILAEIGIYKVDFLFVPFVFEIFRITFSKKQYPSKVLVYATFLAGMAFSMKFVSIFFVAPILLFLLFRYRNFLNIKIIVIASIAGIIPFAVYMAYNLHQTQNPVFPFFDSLFDSPFYVGDYVSQNTAGEKGPKSALEIALWPFYMFLFPSKTAQRLLAYYSGRITLGTLVLIYYLVIGLLNKNNRWILMGIFTLFTSIIWTISSGFIRYGLIQEILVGLIIIELIVYLLKCKNIYLKLSYLLILIMIGQTIYGQFLFITNRVDWSTRKPFYADIKGYFNNIKMIGRDHNSFLGQTNTNIISEKLIADADIWFLLPADHNSEYPALLNNNIPIISMNFSRVSAMNRNIFNNIASNKDFVNKYLVSRRDLKKVSTELSKFNFYILDTYTIYPTFLSRGSPMNLVKISNTPPLIKKGVTVNFDSSILNNNFYPIEETKQGDSFIWSGPETESKILFSDNGISGDTTISFCVLQSLKPEEIKRLKLLVNGSHVNLGLTKNNECPFLFSGKISHEAFDAKSDALEFIFKYPETVSLIDLKRGKDPRKLGFSLTWLRIE